MRILWVKADRLLPVQNGGNIRSYHIARSLAERHALTFFSYYRGAPDSRYESDLREEFPRAVCQCMGASKLSTPRRAVDYAWRLPQRAPYAVSRFASDPVRKKLAAWFEQAVFDVVVCDFLDAAINFPGRLTIPSVLFQHNVESEIWRRHAVESAPLKRLAYKLEFQKMLAYEESIVRKFQHVIAVSAHDRELMSRWVEPGCITVVPTGVDLKNFRSGEEPSGGNLVVFVGAMDWEPNVDAVEYFCGEIWPAIKKDIPSARFRIVGRNPGRRVQKLASDSIEVTGSVPSVQRHLQNASVVVVPLRIGGGTRLKIYEAMAMGRAVVSTSVGAEGLDVHDGQDIALADQADAFAQAVKTLLQDAALRRKLEVAAVQLAHQYDWPEIGKRFAEVLETVAEAKSESPERGRALTQEVLSTGESGR